MRYRNLVAVLPVYGPYGNGSLLLDLEGKKNHPWRAGRVMEEIFHEMRLSLKSSAKIYGKRMHLHRNVPLVVDAERIFLPVKVRRPSLKNDGAYGYVRYDMVERAEDKSLVLLDERRISTLHKQAMLELILGRGLTARSLALGEETWLG